LSESKKAKETLAFLWAGNRAGILSNYRATKRRALRNGGFADKAGALITKQSIAI
jgi:hypothetical protein